MAVQKILDTDELRSKVNPLTITFIITLLVVGFYAGASYSKIQAQDEVQRLTQEFNTKFQEQENEHVEEMRMTLHQYALDEIQGLRSDVVKEDNHLQKQIDEIKNSIKPK